MILLWREGEVIANGLPAGPALVTIKAPDAGFSSHGCATWTNGLKPITGSPTAAFGQGTYIVRVDVAAGTWQAPGGSCYWERLRGFGGELADIIANGLASGTAIVTIPVSDKGFSSSGCGSWIKIG